MIYVSCGACAEWLSSMGGWCPVLHKYTPAHGQYTKFEVIDDRSFLRQIGRKDLISTVSTEL